MEENVKNKNTFKQDLLFFGPKCIVMATSNGLFIAAVRA